MAARRGCARRCVAAFVVLAALHGTSCGGAWGPAAPPGRIARTDLETIVLTADDAPAGTAYVGAVSGFQDLGTFARDAEELAQLRDDGFVVGHLALFFPVGHTEGSEALTTRSVIVQGITGLFGTGAGARSALERFVSDLRERQIPAATDVVTGSLGDQAFGLSGRTADGTHVLIFAWRVDNLVLAVSGSGRISPAAVRAIAGSLQLRADAAGRSARAAVSGR